VNLTTRLVAVIALAVLSLSVADVAYASTWTVQLRTGSSTEAQAQALPATPAGVTAACATPASNKQITVAWSAPAGPATDFVVLQSYNGGTYGSVSTLSGTTWTSGAGLAAGTYAYEVETQLGSNWASGASSPSGTLTIKKGKKGCE
jgi:hypothetical protein